MKYAAVDSSEVQSHARIAPSGKSEFINSDCVHRPSLPSITSSQITCSIVEDESIYVARIQGEHDQRGVYVLVLWHSAAGFNLTLDRRSPAKSVPAFCIILAAIEVEP